MARLFSRFNMVVTFLAIALAAVVCTPTAAGAAEASPNLITNGGFEQGLNNWLYEQWVPNRPAPGAIDKQVKKEGEASFKMGLPDAAEGRYLGHEIRLEKPDQDYILSVTIKCQDVPADSVHARLGIDGKGWLGAGTGQIEILKTGGTHDWKEFKIPVLASALGDSKKLTLFIYHDQMNKGFAWIDAVALKVASDEELKGLLPEGTVTSHFTGETSHSKLSTFAIGEKVELTFRASKLKPDQTSMKLTIVDEHNTVIESKEIPIQPDASGVWKTKVIAPSDKLGFYRAKAQLSDGTELGALGSRPAGFLTYIVVPNPADRVDYGEKDSYFGMQAAGDADVCSYLGIRWVLDDGLFWRRTEPHHAGEFGPEQIKKFASVDKPGSSKYRVYALPTLFVVPEWASVPETFAYQTGKLTPEGEKAWAIYCAAAAKAFAAKYPDRKEHIYQITWEPIAPWGFKGTDADLLRIYEIAYKALHDADPLAVVAGPCRGIYSNGDPPDTLRLFKMGLTKYLDGYTSHPYFSMTPERDGMPQAIRIVKEAMQASAGRELPMFGTEQGWSTEEDPDKELLHAQGLMRQNIITMGEGYRFNLAFYLYDYRLSGQKGYGYFYNLDPAVPFGTTKMSPKPAAAAYAAQSLLLDGMHSAGAIEWLGQNSWGYAFERGDLTTLALWNYGHEPYEATIPTGVAQVQVYDWMGNGQTVATPNRQLKIKLGPEPVYVRGVSNMMWGSQAQKVLQPETRKLQVFTGGRAVIAGQVNVPGDKPGQGSLVLEADGKLSAMTRAVTLGGGQPSAFSFSLDVPPSWRPEMHTLHLRLRDADGQTITTGSVTLDVQAPLAITMNPAFTSSGHPALAVTVQERQGKAATGQLAVSLKELLPGAARSDAPMIDLVVDPGQTRDVPNAARQLQLNVPAKGTQQLMIDLPAAALTPTRRYQALAKVTLAGGSSFAQTSPAQFMAAARRTSPVTIDGNLSEWSGIAPVTISAPQDVIRSPKLAPKNLSANFRYAWDADTLYLAVEVNDPVFVQKYTEVHTWMGDSLQLAFNLDPRADAGATQRTSEINVALTPAGPQAFRSLSFASDKLVTGLISPEQFKLAVKNSGGKLIYEMAVPWTTLGAQPGETHKAGDAIGIAATVNDVQSAEQTDPSALGLFGGIFPDKSPDKQGVLTLQQ